MNKVLVLDYIFESSDIFGTFDETSGPLIPPILKDVATGPWQH
jgi:hypothetical protein